jgi:hypothetical protein
MCDAAAGARAHNADAPCEIVAPVTVHSLRSASATTPI